MSDTDNISIYWTVSVDTLSDFFDGASSTLELPSLQSSTIAFSIALFRISARLCATLYTVYYIAYLLITTKKDEIKKTRIV